MIKDSRDQVLLGKEEFTDLMRHAQLQAARIESLSRLAVKRRNRIIKLEARIAELESEGDR